MEGGPVQEIIHEGLYIGNLGREGRFIRLPEVAQQRLRQIHQRMVVVRDADAHRAGQESGHGRLSRPGGHVHQRKLGSESPHRDGSLDEKRIIGDHGNALGHQTCRDRSPFRIAADQDGDVAQAPARGLHGTDSLQDRRQLGFRIVAEQHVHGALGSILETNLLTDVAVDGADLVPAQQAVQFAGGEGEEFIVEADDRPAGPVIPVQDALGARGQAEFLLETGLQQVPVGAAETVDGLLDVAHDQVVEAGRVAVVQQRAEVLPLDQGRILELVQEEVLETDAQFLIDEGGVGPVDDILEDGVGFVDAKDVLLLLDLGEGLPQFAGDTQPIDLGDDEPGRPVLLVARPEQGAKGIQGPFQVAFQLQAVLVFALGEPLRAVRRLIQEGGRGFFDLRIGVGVHVIVQRFQEAAVAVGGIHAVPLQDVEYRLRGRFHILYELLRDRLARLADFFEPALGVCLLLIDPETADGRLVILGLKAHGHILQRLLEVIAFPLFQVRLHILGQPVQQGPVLLRQGIQDAVDALVHQRLPVEFHLIGSELADFARKGAERLLEELVDRRDGKGRIVVEDAAQLPCGALLQGFRVRADRRDEIRVIRRRLRVGCEDVQFLEDAALHLVGGLVGEGHGEDVAIGLGVPFLQEQTYVFTGQVVGLSRTCGGFQYPYHLPQMFLKSQYSQVLGSPVRRNGTEGSVISSSISLRRSRVRRVNSGLCGQSGSGSVKRRDTE